MPDDVIITGQGSQQAAQSTTPLTGDVSPQNNDTPSAEQLGVSEEQFKKFFKDGKYDWQAHARESDFRAAQAAQRQQRQTQQRQTSDDQGDVDAARQVAEDAGLDWDRLGEKIISRGDIDDADYEALANLGVPEDVVENYITGELDRATAHVERVKDAFGGEQRYEAVHQWAHQNLSPEELQGYDDMLNSGQWQVAVDALLARAGLPPVKNGTTVRTPNAQGTPTVGDTYHNMDEVIADMMKPEYKTDPKFAREVMEKAARSNYQTDVHRAKSNAYSPFRG